MLAGFNDIRLGLLVGAFAASLSAGLEAAGRVDVVFEVLWVVEERGVRG